MLSNATSKLGTCLILDEVKKIEVYSPTSALCWLSWTFQPAKESEFVGRTWSFTNIYGYRAASPIKPGDAAVEPAGWEFVVRDEEVNAIVKATGRSFL
jgi:hypothetical protein